MSRRVRRTSAAAVLSLTLIAGCSGSSTPAPSPTPPTPTVSPTPSPTEALARLARNGVRASYTALYVLRTPKMHGTELVRRTVTRYRVDVDVAGRPRSTLIRTHSSFIACVGRGSGATCGRTDTLPLNFAQPFTAYLVVLARSSTTYTVRRAGTSPARRQVPAGTCFAVSGRPRATAVAVFPGTYCLSGHGVLTKVGFASRSLTLRRYHAGPPAKGAFTPPVKPT